MLTRRRQEVMLELLEKKGSIMVVEIKELLQVSESTIRRDITALHREGKLVKVFGGAVAAEQRVTTHEYTVAQKSEMNREEKREIAKHAARLVGSQDFVYLDAGTTTAHMLDDLGKTGATFVTNAVSHARHLALLGARVILLGGELKGSTEAVVGSQAMWTLRNYHFTKGFFGTNGVTKTGGCTTPDEREAMVKSAAIGQCKEYYVLCDSSKFGQVSSVTFAPFAGTAFLTEQMPEGYEDCPNVNIVSIPVSPL